MLTLAPPDQGLGGCVRGCAPVCERIGVVRRQRSVVHLAQWRGLAVAPSGRFGAACPGAYTPSWVAPTARRASLRQRLDGDARRSLLLPPNTRRAHRFSAGCSEAAGPLNALFWVGEDGSIPYESTVVAWLRVFTSIPPQTKTIDLDPHLSKPRPHLCCPTPCSRVYVAATPPEPRRTP